MEANLLALIVADPAVGHGQACIRGSRVPVSVVLDCLAPVCQSPMRQMDL
ncbi:DUF433 domain-containing protein [Frankia sp. Ag45/Mut15]|uniref:DUF433 domain-containing protein n=1 Tax=Frankia umida TaxID=573489 RepID=A0ABT0K5P3_9ACTN|nr:DUF433 domain-containing protein [Frankia umida]MCK9878832.1 DUF433 domain-containing protein [Frankia umida]